MAGCAPHIIVQTVDPSIAPEAIGDHWVNTTTRQEFRSMGTNSIADWVLVPTADNSVLLTFEAVSKNIRSWDATITYLSTGDIDTISYTDGISSILKTFAYVSGDLTTLTLSGDTPLNIDLIKTFIYTSGDMTGWEYS